MTLINLTTEINAKIEICFDVSRDIDIHKLSTKNTREEAIAGRMNGLCELDDTITWRATHLGIRQKLTVRITQFDRPHYFEDIMLKGAFKSMKHQHYFEEKNGITIMKDKLEYSVPFGFIGKIFDAIYLKKYMTRFLLTRNEVLKSVAENKNN